jgi:hypothetical protein
MGASKIFVAAWVVAAGALLWAASWLHAPLDTMAQRSQMQQPGQVAAADRPDIVLLNTLPGGLKTAGVTYLWIQSQELKDKGRDYDAMQKADLICKLEPHFTGVWRFHAWNMAYNISVAKHTPEERWLWVYNGAKLLRDEGIPVNPYALILYKELGWIFWHKMGQTSDEMYWSYNQRWAARMHYVLGGPPMGSTNETLAAIASLAQAPLDKAPSRQGRYRIQPDRLRWIIDPNEQARNPQAAGYFDPQAQEYAKLLNADSLKECRIDITELGKNTSSEDDLDGNGCDRFLRAYNRFSLDDSVALRRNPSRRPSSDAEVALANLINDKQFASARGKLVSFVRAQVLWNEYKMDPQFMLDLMGQYGPLDWRLVQAQGLYWVSYGMKVCRARGQVDIDTLNTSREVLNCLKDMVWQGRLVYEENVDHPDQPDMQRYADWRFIEYAQKQHMICIQDMCDTKGFKLEYNELRAGHENFLIEAILVLYASQRRDENGNLLAQHYLDAAKALYGSTDPGKWNKDLHTFAIEQLNVSGVPILDRARTQISISIQAAYVALARGDGATFNERMDYAKLVFNKYQPQAQERNKLPPLRSMEMGIAGTLVGDPAYMGENLNLLDRIHIYQAPTLSDDAQLRIYVNFAGALYQACQAQGMDFNRSFPRPAGLERFLQEQGAPKATTQPRK